MDTAMATNGSFDEAKLAALAKQVPVDLQILRLRLRFGLPQSLVLGQRFRIALELVNEMGQSVALSPTQREGLSIRIAHELSKDSALSSNADVELTVREVCVSSNAHQRQQRKCRTWSFDAVFTRKRQSSDASTQSMNGVSFQATTEGHCSAEAPLKAILSIQLRRQGTSTSSSSSDKSALETPEQEQAQEDKTAASAASAFHFAFQQFCVSSTWLDASTLVLALHSQPIELKRSTADAIASPSPATTTSSTTSATNLYRRVFAVESLASSSPSLSPATTTATPAAAASSTPKQQLVEITENYGDTMGAHIWDASILLSYALCHASRDKASFSGVLELGAGCGLFAAVYIALHGVSTHDALPRQHHHVVLTERAESIGLLEANLQHNRISSDHEAIAVTVAPLVWGSSPPVALAALLDSVCIDAIFAADVLYSWSAHEALLTSLDAFVAQQERRDQRTSDHAPPTVVTIAHKHRSRTTSAQLERAVQRDYSQICASAKTGACAWTHWRVTRTARLGAVDLLELRRASTTEAADTDVYDNA